ncbi:MULTISPECIES: homoserine kinase [Aminobacterium]|jgi:homoserine kinase|uniref:Homoserine kinase n=1 Tax=Aminobacterium colombiense (strain DSM 12261 / ALA-1) TaxID=572547 RepID=D5EDS7_AMICL|nr:MULTISPECIES: homoserine kinase [Aminobacterium]MDD2380002.1 homoserine kinase [Aminobacterium colombiense]ADE56709.1 homoserine kinase [Aminobacterium colombiense DSM 12261]MDD3767991.1 homoserine kinase [Aminobacterium colombiense]MDD4265351.1 homoserine kinase [Aminobacterium colombiense]MDD4585922.1 homoserine kinase [Aminobacterium colombiense]
MRLFRVKVPASSANLGSGFDTLGLGLSLYNFFDVRAFLKKGSYVLEIIGEGSGELGRENNALIQSYEFACNKWGIDPPGLDLCSLNAIPMARGLGSSSTAIVAGVAIANTLRENSLQKDELLSLMVELEGHPDNVVPCCMGGMVVSGVDGGIIRFVKMPPLPEDMVAVVAVPEVRVSTQSAREALPTKVFLKDAVYNISRAALLAASWSTGNWSNLPWAMGDRLHQPFRARLFPGGEEILRELSNAPNCSGVAISGSGPSMIAFARGLAGDIAKLMCSIFSRHGIRSRFFVLREDREGLSIF